ncbi:MAG: HypC/HybG/HupF family hydrogenase formation chaperone [Thermoplasmata archaeon]|jgi:hydrogenase expression/formation protein HypC|nr:HypC/HybG/HupF family hydrogenase formation chaperone [Thermoplasmata archaeon]
MCLSIPGMVLRMIEETPEARTAEVDFSGIRRTVNLVFLPEAGVGDFVIVHAGFATALIPESEALEAQEHFRQIQQLTGSTDA